MPPSVPLFASGRAAAVNIAASTRMVTMAKAGTLRRLCFGSARAGSGRDRTGEAGDLERGERSIRADERRTGNLAAGGRITGILDRAARAAGIGIEADGVRSSGRFSRARR